MEYINLYTTWHWTQNSVIILPKQEWELFIYLIYILIVLYRLNILYSKSMGPNLFGNICIL